MGVVSFLVTYFVSETASQQETGDEYNIIKVLHELLRKTAVSNSKSTSVLTDNAKEASVTGMPSHLPVKVTHQKLNYENRVFQ